MEQIISMIEWVPVLVSFVLAYVLGWLWYSPVMFYEKWRTGKGAEVVQYPMWMPMAAQAGATLLLAILINIFMVYENIAMSVLVSLTIAGFIKANGLFAGKTKWAVSIETLFVLAMGAIMIAVNIVI